MAFEIRVRESISLGGRSASSQTSITGEGLASKEITVAAAKIGALTTRTDDETGTLTMNASHGITTGVIIDLYWSGGSRRGILVGTVSVNSVPIGADNAGEGDVLPADETAITACVRTEEALAVVGNNVVAIEYYSDKRGTIVLASSADAELAATFDGLGLNQERSQLWFEQRDPVNPLAGDTVAKAFFSNGDATASATMRVQCLYN